MMITPHIAVSTPKAANRRAKAGPHMNPLPSLLRASAWDAGSRNMRDAGRTVWSRADYNCAAETQNRLISACYGKPDDTQPTMCFIRFQVAEQWQKTGYLDLYSDWATVISEIDAVLNAAASREVAQPCSSQPSAP